MPEFKPGQKPGPGRPKGSKDHRWASIGYWFEEIKKDWDKLTPNQRSSYSIELIKLLVHKAKALPVDPQDSAFNAEEAMSELKRIESKTYIKSSDGHKLP